MNGLATPSTRGSLIVCIDLELAWGWALKGGFERWEGRFMRGRAAIPRLLDMFERFQVPATWATVGHLFLDSCQGHRGVPHPDIIRPSFPWLAGDWYQHDPMGNVRSHPLWYGTDLVAAIRERAPQHEIGSHSFGHLLFGAPGLTRDAAESDLRAAGEAAESIGVDLRTFVYPQHSFGFEDLLAPRGFTAFRAEDREPFLRLPRRFRKPLRLLARSVGVGFQPQRGEVTAEGLVDLPASMFFSFPDSRNGRVISPSSLVRACRGGIRRAITNGSMFQIYFHDHNMGVRTDEFFEAMNGVLSLAAHARDANELEVVTLGDYARRVVASASPPEQQ